MADRSATDVGASDEPLAAKQIEQLRMSMNRGRLFGDEDWIAKTAKRLGLGNTLRGVGRPRKVAGKATGH